MDLAAVTVATFEPLVGDVFAIDAQPAAVALVLDSATTLGPRPGGRDPFTLVFRGPPEPLLAQRMYQLEHDGLGVLEIFVVPIGRDAGGARYEAIFT